jgi:hypothetical protein
VRVGRPTNIAETTRDRWKAATAGRPRPLEGYVVVLGIYGMLVALTAVLAGRGDGGNPAMQRAAP